MKPTTKPDDDLMLSRRADRVSTEGDILLSWALGAEALQVARQAMALARQAGPQGDPGLDGLDGEPGRDGIDGIDGEPGLPGRDGRDGRDAQPTMPMRCEWERNALGVTMRVVLHTPRGRLEVTPRHEDGYMVSADFKFIADADDGARS